MDCNFFFDGGTVLGEHFGEKITSLPALPKNIEFEVIETGVEVSSLWAYQQVDLKRCGKNVGKTQKLVEAICAQDSAKIVENMHNDFENFIFAKYPQLLKKKIQIESEKNCRALLCGSGGALMGICEK